MKQEFENGQNLKIHMKNYIMNTQNNLKVLKSLKIIKTFEEHYSNDQQNSYNTEQEQNKIKQKTDLNFEFNVDD